MAEIAGTTVEVTAVRVRLLRVSSNSRRGRSFLASVLLGVAVWTVLAALSQLVL